MSNPTGYPTGLLNGGAAEQRAVLIFGTGDYARAAATLMREESGVTVKAFVVHAKYRNADELLGLPVVDFEGVADRFPPADHVMFVAVGYSKLNEHRASACRQMLDAGYELATYVSPNATVSSTAKIGANTFVFEQNNIQPFVTIGDDVVLWSGNHVGHDSTIQDHCFIASHAVISGNVTIGHHTFVGVNATFRDGITVGSRNIVGAGALLLKDTADGDVYSVRRTELHTKRSDEIVL